MKRTLVLTAVLSFLSLGLLATDIFVTPTGGGDNSGSSWSNAINGSEHIVGLRIKEAITNAFANSASEINVYLAGGTYTTSNSVSIARITVPVRFSGGYVATTDGSFEKGDTPTVVNRNASYNLRFLYAENLTSLMLNGITFSGGYLYASTGTASGGALALLHTTTSIENCSFLGNHVNGGSYATLHGGAIFTSGGSITIKDSEFKNNYVLAGYNAQYGGGIYTSKTDISIDNCTFENNYAKAAQRGGYGGALSLHGYNVVIKNSIFKKNYVLSKFNTGTGYPHGGAFSIRSAVRAEISDCQFFDNYVRVFNDRRSAATISCFYLDDFNASDGVMTSVVTRCVFDSSGIVNKVSKDSSKYFKSDFLLNCGRLFMTNCLIANARGTHEDMKYSIRATRTAPCEKDPLSLKNTIVVTPCELNLVNCTIADGKGNGAMAQEANSTLNLENCILWGNTLTGIVNAASVKYTCSQEEQVGEGNFVADPLWTGKPYYHLITKAKNGYIQDGYFGGTFNGEKSAVSSPCIDAGITNAPNHIFEPHAKGRRINLGAYGGTPWASKTYYQLGTQLRLQ